MNEPETPRNQDVLQRIVDADACTCARNVDAVASRLVERVGRSQKARIVGPTGLHPDTGDEYGQATASVCDRHSRASVASPLLRDCDRYTQADADPLAPHECGS